MSRPGQNERCRRWRLANPEKERAKSKRWRDANRDKIRDIHLRGRFGITVADYNRMLSVQEGLCGICRKPETQLYRGKPNQLAVDHCHSTGRVRGLLCNRCNRAIGLLEDDVELVVAAAEYLRR